MEIAWKRFPLKLAYASTVNKIQGLLAENPFGDTAREGGRHCQIGSSVPERKEFSARAVRDRAGLLIKQSNGPSFANQERRRNTQKGSGCSKK
ncbi:Hypothetical protein NTJ_02831 [Nesidiocoris tenuis]|uniref:Uncharacterized protein n=1 Tax=Nesidiocoris tenuis TaxID=355587 RepID=A0ABN7AI65_9HEMI|nr:Hypothetical protein NTJ_02831 [Nesidiocoris tenuis]